MTKLNYNYLYKYLDLIKYNNSLKYKILKSLVRFFLRVKTKKKILFIFGFQRSGTSITFHTLNQLFGVKGYGEFSELSEKGDEKLRFKNYRDVNKKVQRNLEPYILNKPLVESQIADKTLNHFPNAYGIWMYRNYKDVILSFNKKFGESSGKFHLITVIKGTTNNWRAERVPKKFRKIAISFIEKDLTNYDYTALYWYIKNSLFFEYDFYKLEKLKLLKYEFLIKNPESCIKNILKHWCYSYNTKSFKHNFKNNSINKGVQVELNPEIESLCDGLLEKLDFEFEKQSIYNAKK